MCRNSEKRVVLFMKSEPFTKRNCDLSILFKISDMGCCGSKEEGDNRATSQNRPMDGVYNPLDVPITDLPMIPAIPKRERASISGPGRLSKPQPFSVLTPLGASLNNSFKRTTPGVVSTSTPQDHFSSSFHLSRSRDGRERSLGTTPLGRSTPRSWSQVRQTSVNHEGRQSEEPYAHIKICDTPSATTATPEKNRTEEDDCPVVHSTTVAKAPTVQLIQLHNVLTQGGGDENESITQESKERIHLWLDLVVSHTAHSPIQGVPSDLVRPQ